LTLPIKRVDLILFRIIKTLVWEILYGAINLPGNGQVMIWCFLIPILLWFFADDSSLLYIPNEMVMCVRVVVKEIYENLVIGNEGASNEWI